MIRTIDDNISHAGQKEELSAGPLRILFMACSPDGTEPLLDYEKEEEIVLGAVAELKRKKELEIDMAEGGTLKELKEMLARKDYHLVHLSGHGYYDGRTNTGYLCMENEWGTEKRVSAKELAEILIGCSSVRLLFLSACQSVREDIPNTGLARSLMANGLPVVIGMKQTIGDYAASSLAGSFYRHLTLKRSVAQALQLARSEFAKDHKGNFQWAIPAIFCRSDNTSISIVDWAKPSLPIKDRESSVILYGRVKHLKVGFRGRRREIREYLEMLRKERPSAICITGAGGIGKSTLSSKLTDRLHKSGYMVIPLYGELTPDTFIQGTLNSLVSQNEWEHLDRLKKLSDYNEQLFYIMSNVSGIKETIYLLDNFEDNLKQSAEFKDFKNPFWEETFKTLQEQLPHTLSKMMITCRYSIPKIPEELLLQKPLQEMSEGEVRKLVIFNADYAGISLKQIKEVYRTIGGNPKALEELGKLFKRKDISWDILQEKLEMVKKEMREFTIFEQLYNFLSPEEQSFFRKVSVYLGPVHVDGIKLMEPDEARIKFYLNKLLDYSLIQKYENPIRDREYYQVHPLNRGHIRAEWWKKGEEERAHREAANYYFPSGDNDFNLGSLIKAVYHLRSGKEYNRSRFGNRLCRTDNFKRFLG